MSASSILQYLYSGDIGLAIQIALFLIICHAIFGIGSAVSYYPLVYVELFEVNKQAFDGVLEVGMGMIYQSYI